MAWDIWGVTWVPTPIAGKGGRDKSRGSGHIGEGAGHVGPGSRGPRCRVVSSPPPQLTAPRPRPPLPPRVPAGPAGPAPSPSIGHPSPRPLAAASRPLPEAGGNGRASLARTPRLSLSYWRERLPLPPVSHAPSRAAAGGRGAMTSPRRPSWPLACEPAPPGGRGGAGGEGAGPRDPGGRARDHNSPSPIAPAL